MSKGLTLKQAARDALACQDACNLSGVAHSFLAAVQAVNEEAHRLGEGTEWRNHHPVIQLYVDKLAHLAGIQFDAGLTIAAACHECHELAAGGD